jgi:acylphosphatase
MKHLRLKIHGRVQGVFFRVSTKEKADELGLVGWVRNDDDGTVSVEAEGSEDKLRELLKWCHEGSQGSQVEKIEEEWSEELVGFEEFEVVRI